MNNDIYIVAEGDGYRVFGRYFAVAPAPGRSVNGASRRALETAREFTAQVLQHVKYVGVNQQQCDLDGQLFATIQEAGERVAKLLEAQRANQ